MSGRDMRDVIDFEGGEIFHYSIWLKPGVPFEEQRHLIYEDMLLVKYLDTIDVGCYDSEKRAISVSVAGDTRRVLFDKEVYSVEELKEALDQAVRVVHDILDDPDEVSPYTSVFATPNTSPYSVDHLLGKVEIEWEGKMSNVTEDMIVNVEKAWGVQLPNELRKVVGGGSIPLYCNKKDTYEFFQYILSFQPEDADNVYDFWKSHQDHMPDQVYPIGLANNLSIWLDYRGNSKNKYVQY